MVRNSIVKYITIWLFSMCICGLIGCSEKYTSGPGNGSGTETSDEYLATITMSHGIPAARLQVIAMRDYEVVDTNWILTTGSWSDIPNAVLDSTDSEGLLTMKLDSGTWSVYATAGSEVIQSIVTCDTVKCIGDSTLSMGPKKIIQGTLQYEKCDSNCGEAFLRVRGLPIGVLTSKDEYVLAGLPQGSYTLQLNPKINVAFSEIIVQATLDSQTDTVTLDSFMIPAALVESSIWRHHFTFDSDSIGVLGANGGVVFLSGGDILGLATSWSAGLQTLTLGIRFNPDSMGILTNLVMDSSMSFRIGYGGAIAGAYSTVLINRVSSDSDYYNQPQSTPVGQWNTTWACFDFRRGVVLWKVNDVFGKIVAPADSISYPTGPLHLGGSWQPIPSEQQNFQGAIDDVWMGENLPCDSTWMSTYPM